MKGNKFIKKCIKDSLLILMNEKNLKDITITEITEKAGVSRMAYYRNYTYKEDILKDYFEELKEEYLQSNIEEKDIYNRFLFAFNFFHDNKELFIALEKSNLSSIIQDKLNEYMTAFYPNNKNNITQKYRLYILSGAIYNASKMWLLNGTKESPETLATIFYERLFPENNN